jgi:hypothetical protein
LGEIKIRKVLSVGCPCLFVPSSQRRIYRPVLNKPQLLLYYRYLTMVVYQNSCPRPSPSSSCTAIIVILVHCGNTGRRRSNRSTILTASLIRSVLHQDTAQILYNTPSISSPSCPHKFRPSTQPLVFVLLAHQHQQPRRGPEELLLYT